MPVKLPPERMNSIAELEAVKNKVQSRMDYVKRQLDAIPGRIEELEAGSNHHLNILDSYSPARIEYLRKTKIGALRNEAAKYTKQIAGYAERIAKVDKRLASLNKQTTRKSRASAIIDKAAIDRFIFFRKKYIDEAQNVASEKLGIVASTVSTIESYKRNLPTSLIKSLESKFSLNVAWLLTGKGTPTIGPENPKELRQNMLDMQVALGAAEKRIAVLEHNINRLYELMEKMAKG
jgi:DNA repair ATPase RecN